jgi:hypothetical protein
VALAPGTLKLVAGCSTSRSLRDAIQAALRAHVPDDGIRPLHTDTFLVYTDAQPSAIRDWLAPSLAAGESVLVVEFERWSGHGPAPDREWLLRRGH